MSFDGRLVHTLVVKHLVPSGDLDAHGAKISTEETFAEDVRALIQPMTTQEVALVDDGGAVASTHIGYMRPLAGLTTAMWIEHAGVRYDITGIPDAAGLGHHLELPLRAVV